MGCVWKWVLLATLVFFTNVFQLASALGSMSSIAISYGVGGPIFCGLKSDGSHFVVCYGSNSAILYGTPSHFQFIGLTGGDGFMCGLLMQTHQPYCWGNSGFIQMGVPQPMVKGAEYLEISAGDYHLCGLRKSLTGRLNSNSNSSILVDCWGYNMTRNFVFDKHIHSLSAGSEFNCGLTFKERSAFCWGDESSSQVISLIPKETRFQKIVAGGYHVCGILEGLNSRVLCWGKSLDFEEDIAAISTGEKTLSLPPKEPLLTIVGGRFYTCGIKSSDHTVVCWGFFVNRSTPAPKDVKFYELASGNYFTCGVLLGNSSSPVCWGLGFPASIPLAVSPGLCREIPCPPGTYELSSQENSPCLLPGSHLCLPCSTTCLPEMYQKSKCTEKSDQVCVYNCSSCVLPECLTNCSSLTKEKRGGRFWSLQLRIVTAEIGFIVFVIALVSLAAVLYVQFRLRHCKCSGTEAKSSKDSTFTKENGKIRSDLDELKLRRARIFTYEELEKAAEGFKEESLVGKGSFSCVYKGVLRDGTTVAVKKAIVSSDIQKNSKEFRTELDLLSRLNHAHLLNLLGYCEEGGERLLVYEFMAHGSLHNHLHGKNKALKEQLNWVKRVTIAVQAARGIEYLHGYACPPVIHRDIKSSNILIDEEHNARVSDFGLSLLGPVDSSSPLAELPAGTLGYLDPEYYRLHYLTTKSDVYSFGVLLLEILSGRKAIDMQFEEGNIVEWAVPLIKTGDISGILDPVLKPPLDTEPLKRIASTACKCVRMRGKERPSMDKVTTSLERALAQLMGSPSSEQRILPTEVVLGSSRMHKKSSRFGSENNNNTEGDQEMQRSEFRGGSWITFPSVTSSQRRKSSASEGDVVVVVAAEEGRNHEVLRSLEKEIGPASPQESLFLHHNF